MGGKRKIIRESILPTPDPSSAAGSVTSGLSSPVPSDVMSTPSDSKLAMDHSIKRVLASSRAFAKMMATNMAQQREESAKAQARREKKQTKPAPRAIDVRESSRRKSASSRASDSSPEKRTTTTGKRKAAEEEEMGTKASSSKKRITEESEDESDGEDEGEGGDYRQSSLVTGASLRDYQLEGARWLDTLFLNGFSGILADEMGLGKTIQTIAYIAGLKDKGYWGPSIIVCPLSVAQNWVKEFKKFAPSIPVVLLHGTPEYRREIAVDRLGFANARSNGLSEMGFKMGEDLSDANKNLSAKDKKKVAEFREQFPVIITTYEIIKKDFSYLERIKYNLVVVDEAQSIKNDKSQLHTALKRLQANQRLLLTGTPLQNNMDELFSLLSFVQPQIFQSVESFRDLFDLSNLVLDVDEKGDKTAPRAVVDVLHEILNPFMLRRMKKDVETELPLKKEYVLTAPLTKQQKDLYDATLSRDLRGYLLNQINVDEPEAAPVAEEVDDTPGQRKTRRRSGKQNFAELEQSDDSDLDDDEFEERMRQQEDRMSGTVQPTAAELGLKHRQQMAQKTLNNKKLQNVVMQLRKAACHPYLHHWPVNRAGQYETGPDLINASGKMLLLDQLLAGLFERDHKVLIFSQFKTMLDVIYDWATVRKSWDVCRIDGETKSDEREVEIERFNQGSGVDAPRLFLLTTRAGGVGINLVGADTVIFFDSDWNPQADLQAMARAHRIGQKKPVLVFRLVTANTVEGKILEKAGGKRKLEALVIGQGEFKGKYDLDAVIKGTKKKEKTMAELAQELFDDTEEEQVVLTKAGDEILSDKQLEALLDRSPATMTSQKSAVGAKVINSESLVIDSALSSLLKSGDEKESDETK